MTSMSDPTLTFGFETLDQIAISTPASNNGYGEKVYNDPVVYPGRVFRKTQVKFEHTSSEFVSSATAYLDTAGAEFPIGSRLQIVGDPTAYTVRAMDVQRDETGALHHIKVYVQ